VTVRSEGAGSRGDPGPGERLALYAPTRVDRPYLWAWCVERADSVSAVSHEALAAVAPRVSENLKRDRTWLEGLTAFDGDAWSRVFELVQSAVRSPADDELVGSLEAVAYELLVSMLPAHAARRDGRAPRRRDVTPGWLAVSSLAEWIRFVAVRAEVDRAMRLGGHEEEELLRDRGRSALRELLAEIAGLRERQRFALTLGFWAGDAQRDVTDILLELADELVADRTISNRAELFPLERHEQLRNDREIARWMERRFGGTVRDSNVRVNRRHARRKLAGDDTRNHLLNLLLGRVNQSRDDEGGKAERSDEERELTKLLERAARSGSLRLFELLVERDCRRFAATLPWFVSERRAAGDTPEALTQERGLWRDLPQHLRRCTRCRKTAERLLELDDPPEAGAAPTPEKALHAKAEADPPPSRPLPPLVQRALAQILNRPDMRREVKLRLLTRMRGQPELDHVAIVAIQALLTAVTDQSLAKAAWETLEAHAHLIHDVADLEGRGVAIVLRAQASRGAVPVVTLQGSGAQGRLSHVGGRLRLRLNGLPERLAERRLRFEGVTRDGSWLEGFEFGPPRKESVEIALPGTAIDPGILGELREVYVGPAKPLDGHELALDLVRRSEEEESRGNLYGALRYTQHALVLSEKIHDDAERAEALLQAGRVYIALGYFRAAERVLADAKAAAVRTGDRRIRVEVEHGLAQLARAECRWDDAESHIEQGLALADRDDALREQAASLLVDAAHTQIALGHPDEAVKMAHRAKIRFEPGDEFGVATAEHALAAAERARGDYGEAERAVFRALASIRRSRERSRAERQRLEGEIRCTHGKTLHSVGRYDEALEHFRTSLELMYECGSPAGEANALAARGRVHEVVGNLDRASRTYERAGERFKEIADRAGVGEMLGSLARVEIARAAREKDPAKRLELLEKAESLARESLRLRIGDRRGEPIALTDLGGALGALANELDAQHKDGSVKRAEARDKLEVAVVLRKDVNDDRGLAVSLAALAEVVELPEALEHYDRALELHRSSGNRRGEIRTLLALARRTGDADRYYEAIEEIESMRLQTGGDPQRANFLATFADDYENCARVLAPKSAARSLAVVEAVGARALLDRISKRAGGEPVRFEPPAGAPFDPERLRGELRSDEAALAYLAGDPYLLYVVTQDGVAAHPLELGTREATDLVNALREALLTDEAVAAIAKRAEHLLLAPARETLEGARAVRVVLAGALHHLPQAALTGLLSGDPASPLRDTDVWIVPSLAVASKLNELDRAPGDEFVAVVPDGAVAPDGDVPSELDRIRDRFARAGLGPPIVLPGTDADVFAELERAAPLRYLHVAGATEQAWNGPEPNGPADLVLGRNRTWTADELWTKVVDADLVVLSADYAALGMVQPGEGALSLPRAFIAAGARCVCASTLPVEGDAAGRFAHAFYGRLLGGANPATALRQTQRALADSGVDPLDWAGWRITGILDGRGHGRNGDREARVRKRSNLTTPFSRPASVRLSTAP
jgi:tetratricopeptide (TPR) repeat protein